MRPTQTPFLRAINVALGFALLVVATALFAQQRVNIPGSTVSLEVPAGFTPLTAAEIGANYPRGNPPGYVVGNTRRSTSIAYALKPQPISDSELEKELEVLGARPSRAVPSLVYERKEIISMAGQRWILLELRSAAIDTDVNTNIGIHNTMLITPFEGKTLIFNFTSTNEDLATDQAALRASISSIRLK